jgi:hypothetical protein
MANLGSFGAARAEATQVEPDTFEWYGETMRVSDRLGAAPLFDYAAAIVSELDVKDMQAIAATREMLRDTIHEDDWAKFWDSVKKHKSSPEELAELSALLFEHIASRPTVQPSGSAVGPSSPGSDTSTTSSPTPALPAAVTVGGSDESQVA